MTRKLLPYEYELIDALGVSKEEYLEFLAAQQQYNDIKQGTALDIQNGVEVYALVVAIIGVIFQVASVFLSPRPQVPGAPERQGQTQTREQRFSPRFGFNSTQELAKYGDTIPLVYTNRAVNAAGGVRLAGSLLWSAVRSYGSNQFLQMLMLLAGGPITAIDPNKSAFGQTAITDLIAQNKWIYFRPNSTGALRFGDEVFNASATDPTAYGTQNDNPYRLQPTPLNERIDGFSQAYSPSSSATFGGYSPVPLNVVTFLRNSSGDKARYNIRIYASTSFNWNDGGSVPIAVNDLMSIVIDSTEDSQNETTPSVAAVEAASPESLGGKIAKEVLLQKVQFDQQIIDAARDIRRTYASIFDDSGVFKLGSARFRVGRVRGTTPDEGQMQIDLICIEAGISPTVPYVVEGDTGETGSYFFLKALVRIEEATYSTLTKCNIVDMALRCQQFRRISGRQQVYGSEQRPGYSASDNGIKLRTSLFLLKYRVAGLSWNYVPGIFVIRRAADQENYVYLKFEDGAFASAQQWQFQFEPVVEPLSEISKHSVLRMANGTVRYFYIQNSGDTETITLPGDKSIHFTGFYRDAGAPYAVPPLNESPYGTNEWDWFNLDADTQVQASFDRGPEFAITAISEQQREFFTPALYNNLALVGLNVFSGKNLQDMRSFSAFITQGKPVRRLDTSPQLSQSNPAYPSTPDGPSCYAPDIFLDTVIDSVDGIGNYAELQGIDTYQLAVTKRFCVANNLFMDGLIADRQSWREFWTQTAPFSLLEFARIGGRETLIPAVPYNATTGAMDRRVNISALFNQGNILEDSYKEEFMDYNSSVQDLIATVIYRTVDSNGIFFTNRSVSIQRSDINENDAIRETFDLSAFVTTEAQAILFGKLLCNTRRYVRSAVEFKTYPTTSPVSPGSYIYVDIGLNAWDNIRTGSIGAGGSLNIPLDSSVPDGTYNVLLYRSGNDVVSTTATINSNTAPSLSNNEGWLFVLGSTVKTKRVFRVSDVQMDEEGEVTVRATIFPCDSNDNALISDFSSNLFTVRS